MSEGSDDSDAEEEIGRYLEITYHLVAVEAANSTPCCCICVREAWTASQGYGTTMWRGSQLTARWLVAKQEAVKGHSVIEIGAGTGVPGLTAAVLGAKSVILTDGSSQVLDNLTTCLQDAREDKWLRGRVRAHELDFCLTEQSLTTRLEEIYSEERSEGVSTPEILLASECVYSSEKVRGLIRTVQLFFKLGGSFAVVSNVRSPLGNLADTAKEIAASLRSCTAGARAFWAPEAETVEGGTTVVTCWAEPEYEPLLTEDPIAVANTVEVSQRVLRVIRSVRLDLHSMD